MTTRRDLEAQKAAWEAKEPDDQAHIAQPPEPETTRTSTIIKNLKQQSADLLAKFEASGDELAMFQGIQAGLDCDLARVKDENATLRTRVTELEQENAEKDWRIAELEAKLAHCESIAGAVV